MRFSFLSLPHPRNLFAAVGILGIACAATSSPDSGVKQNRLAGESSAYLRMHASDAIDWYPWGEEAFEKARRENKPVFLSIGYSTCHWCHVMARETFSDPVVARLLNSDFVSIKVDREERPDIDRIYMTFVQASTGSGGWPLSVWLTPGLEPFVGGTFFPPDDTPGRPGMKGMLARIAGLWRERQDEIVHQSGRMLDALASDLAAGGGGDSGVDAIRTRAFEQLGESFDPVNGGFDQGAKFPAPSNVEFLFDVAASRGDDSRREEALRMALTTLRSMAAGGIHDHLGGGFHRYAVDESWHVPHFEKMLYDQAQLASVYLAAWQLTREPVFRETAVDILEYMRGRLSGGHGGFFAAEDADSAIDGSPASHAEGAFYVWTFEEIEARLGGDDARLFAHVYGVEREGNMGNEAVPELPGANVLYRARTDAEAAGDFGIPEQEVARRLSLAVKRLLEVRDGRTRPARDEAVIASWNGLAISAFAQAAQVLEDPAWAQVATRAAEFLRANHGDEDGRLSHIVRDGVRTGRGFAEDYAFVIQGLIDLYEATFDTMWLEWALRLQHTQDELFGDQEGGGYFATEKDEPGVILRMKGDLDSAEPSANSVSVRNLARLAALLEQSEFQSRADRTVRAFARHLEQTPTAMPLMLVAAGWLQGSPAQVILQGDRGSGEIHELAREVWSRFIPHRVVALVDAKGREFLSRHVSFVSGLPADQSGAATAYLCENFVCRMPTSDPRELAAQLEELSGARD